MSVRFAASSELADVFSSWPENPAGVEGVVFNPVVEKLIDAR